MLTELESGPTVSSGASDNHLALRKKMVEQLIVEESKHEAMEEMYFWPAVREKVPEGGSLTDRALAQESQGKDVLAKLDKLQASEPEFEKLVREFIDAAREHIAYEESQVWPALRAALSADQASALGTKIEHGKKTAPTRPHPHTPPSPAVLKTAGPAVAAADKIRDAATGRGD